MGQEEFPNQKMEATCYNILRGYEKKIKNI